MERDWRFGIMLVAFGVWVICVLIIWMVTIATEYPDKLEMLPAGTLCFVLVMAVMRYFTYSSFAATYKLAVSMGRTRRSFLTAHLCLEILSIVLMFAVGYGLYRLELLLQEQMGIAVYIFKLDGLFELKNMIILGAFLTVMNLFTGAVYLWNAWVPAAFWILVNIAAVMMINIEDGKEGILFWLYHRFCTMPSYGMVLLSLLSAVLLGEIGRRILYGKTI